MRTLSPLNFPRALLLTEEVQVEPLEAIAREVNIPVEHLVKVCRLILADYVYVVQESVTHFLSAAECERESVRHAP